MDRWFPWLRADGVAAYGSETITVGNRTYAAKGSIPKFRTHNEVIFKGAGDRLFTLDVDSGKETPLTDYPASNFGAGGGQWLAATGGRIWASAGRDGSLAWVQEHSSRDQSVMLDGVEIYRGIANFANVEQRHVVWSTFQPRELWGKKPDGAPQRLRTDVQFGKPVITPHGVWVVGMRDADIIVFPWDSPDLGMILPTGKDQNFWPDALWVNGLVVVWNSHDGSPGRHVFTLTEERVPLSAPTAPPPPVVIPPKEEPGPIMEIPDLFHVVQRVNDEFPHLVRENSKESCTEFLWRAAEALAKEDAGFGLLTKSEGENHTVIAGQRVAVDSITYRKDEVTSDQIRDILKGAGDGPGKGGIAWGSDERRESNQWLKVPAFPVLNPPKPEPTEPTPAEPEPEEPAPADDGLLLLIIEQIQDSVRVELAKLSAQVKTELDSLRAELDDLTFEGKHRLLGTMTFKRKK